ncbi:hypothetical protein C1645_835259 [Glomus cerebriforme]|uniref:Uncharacterized protein n=1 Tax=Glomus cerebriforme TaxID=658196 RepID=A0A397S850_9GLOM|nr:hypothetical protein C1645_835259 [Glomus cerebriforme]
MANEHWEEISEWDIEEDIDLAQRITVHSVHSVDDEEEFQLIQAHKNPTYAAAAKWGDRKSSSSSINKEETSKANNIPNKTPSNKKKLPSTSSKDEKKDDKPADTILKGDHDADYDAISSPTVSSKNWKETRRNNDKLHKVHSQKLMSSLITNAELECNQDLVKGDTNRDPEFKKYKLLKKTMALNKKYTEKPKNDRKNLERVEVW